MGLRSDTHRCRALVYGVERSSYQSFLIFYLFVTFLKLQKCKRSAGSSMNNVL